MKYGVWRDEITAEPGYSKELYSPDFEKYKDQTTLDELVILDDKEVDTIYKAFKKRANDPVKGKIDFLGTRVGTKYRWTSFLQAALSSKQLAAGISKLGLAPDVEAEDKIWRFIGIFSRNREEWLLTHLANMHIKSTTVGIFDSMEEESCRFLVNQTELTTVACSDTQISKLVGWLENDLKLPEHERKMHRVKNLICFDDH